MKRFCFALDLVDDPEMIREYEEHHKKVSKEIKASIWAAGIVVMDLYRVSNRLFMIMETNDDFDFEKKSAMDAADPLVQAWEQLMWKYQQAIPGAASGEKWVLMKQIFALE